jgi:hypothetical protein
MKRRIQIALVVLTGLLGIIGVVALYISQSMRRVPPFYQTALQVDSESQGEASDECLRQAASLASDVQRPGRWQAIFSAEQINGWLAVDLAKNYPNALPTEIENPRVDIQSALATLACGYKQGEQTTVVSISFDLYLSSPSVAAVRVHSVRAGSLPVPLSSVLEAISAAAHNFDLDIQWRQSHGDPVALITLPPASDGDSREIRLDKIELRDGAVYLAGETSPAGSNELARREPVQPTDEPAPDEAAPDLETTDGDDVMSQAELDSSTNENVQR